MLTKSPVMPKEASAFSKCVQLIHFPSLCECSFTKDCSTPTSKNDLKKLIVKTGTLRR